MKGEIEYELWEVTGTRKLTIVYNIQMKDGIGMGSINIKGEGCPPKLDENTMKDILSKCVEDGEKRKKPEVNPFIEFNKFKENFSKN